MEQRNGRLVVLGLLLTVVACSSTGKVPQAGPIVGSTTVDGKPYPAGGSGSAGDLVLTTVATDRSYGYSVENPVKVAGLAESGPRAEKVYLSALRGPAGEAIEFVRQGSCCPFETKNSDFGSGLLDVYKVTYEGLAEPVVLYLDMYDPGEVLVPVGFTGGR